MPPETAAAIVRIETIIWSFPLFRTCGTVLCVVEIEIVRGAKIP